MYRISDKQVDFILDDIRARGVELEDLQLNLLDHICCIIEQNLDESGSFEDFYQTTIRTFYKDALWEIEEETMTLLIFKHYYTMKKLIVLSGIFTSVSMLAGIWFKYMHWPGASLLLPLGILSGSLVFLPLLFTLKAKEQQSTRDKIVLAAGTLSAILFALSFVFKIMAWPHSIDMLYASTAVTLIIFLPLYLVSGLRNPANKLNTIVTSILVIMGYTLIFSLLRTPQSDHSFKLVLTHDFMRNEQILNRERSQVASLIKKDSSSEKGSKIGQEINSLCEEAKASILEYETGQKTIGENSEAQDALLADHWVDPNELNIGPMLNEIKRLVGEYNATLPSNINKIPTKASFMQKERFDHSRSIILLNEITQVQMFVLQNEQELLASK